MRATRGGGIMEGFATEGYVGFLFGIFCAYWAQETGRNPWLWFFFGLILPPLAGIALVYKNAQEAAAT